MQPRKPIRSSSGIRSVRSISDSVVVADLSGVDVRKLRRGLNLVHTASGLRFLAVVVGGEIIEWVITDLHGRELPSNWVREAKAGGCKKCTKTTIYDSDGNFVSSTETCVIVRCPRRRPAPTAATLRNR